jgi:hypothetical protein
MAKSGATTFQQQRILSRDFGNVAYTPPTILYIASSTTTINEDGTGMTEPSTDPAYARVAIDNNTANWIDLLSGAGRQNDIIAEFPPATVNQGTITYIAICDSATDPTNILYYAELVNPKTVGIDDVLRIDSGNLQIRLQPTV